jgi:hypothetical protein
MLIMLCYFITQVFYYAELQTRIHLIISGKHQAMILQSWDLAEVHVTSYIV